MGAACSSDPAKTSQVTSQRATAAPGAGAIATRFQAIRDRFESTDEVQSALRKAGLESSDLVVAIDLTKSNEWSGKASFNGQCLHSLASGMNPYKSVMNIIAKTLSAFDDDQLIPTYGFGDLESKDGALRSFSPSGKPLHGLHNVLAAYEAAINSLHLSGPTSFAPAIYKTIEHVRETGGQYHILLLIADGQVSEGACMSSTVRAIIEASNYPLSIVMVGVGDGPFDKMEEFDDKLEARLFDNFQFVNFTELGKRAAERHYTADKWEADFALSALMEIPDQYAEISKHGLLGKKEFSRPAASVSVIPISAAAYAGSGHHGSMRM